MPREERRRNNGYGNDEKPSSEKPAIDPPILLLPDDFPARFRSSANEVRRYIAPLADGKFFSDEAVKDS